MPYGTNTLRDTLAVQDNQTVAAFGEQRAFDAITAYLAAHNMIVADQLATLVEPTTDRLRKAGGASTLVMQEIDEFGRVDAQKVAAGENLGIPLHRDAIALQWTRDYFQRTTTAELAAQVEAARAADLLNVQKRIKSALFFSANYTFVDRYVDEVTLPIKRLVNADGFSISPGPNGETFTAATHTHYLARAGGALAASDITALIGTVAEHANAGAMYVYINQAQEAAVRAMASNFTPYVDARIRVGNGITVGDMALDTGNVYNRAIGLFDQAEVWVKPWVPAGYLLSWLDGVRKPLAWRTPLLPAGAGEFLLAYDNEQFPLRAQQWERMCGVGVQNRTAAAVLFAGGAVYVNPTL